jgi:hypothetical protein
MKAGRFGLRIIYALVLAAGLGGQAPAGEAVSAPVPSLSEAVKRDIIREFVLANTEFTLLHEFGHAFLHYFDVPVLGYEEDAADQLATMVMIRNADLSANPAGVNKLLMVSAEWRREWLHEGGYGTARPAYWDNHSLAIQRFFNVNCLVYGGNPVEFAFLMDSQYLPAERGFVCEDEYKVAEKAGHWIEERFGRRLWERLPGFGYDKISILYKEPRTPLSTELMSWMREEGLAERVAGRAEALYAWPEPLTIRFEACPGNSDAYFNNRVGEIVVCHELLEKFHELALIALREDLQEVCANAGLRRLFGARIGCPVPAP